MESKLGLYLEMNEENIINMKTMPWLDIGDLPQTYNMKKSESWQVFMHPTSRPPNSMIVEYREWAKQYDFPRVKMTYGLY
jgi:hypothetical protein